MTCNVTSPNGGSTSHTATAWSIDLREGENVTCTFVNTHTVNTPSVSTTLTNETKNTSAAGGNTLQASIGDVVHDAATMTGATSDAGGTISYAYYTDAACSLNAVSATPATNTVTNGSAPNSTSKTFNAAGTFYWQATYSGDANNTGPVSSPCNEILVVAPNAPTVSTTLHNETQNTSKDGGTGNTRARALGDEIVVNQSLLMRASAYRKLGDPARAQKIVDEAESRSRRPGAAPILSAAVAYERAMLAQARGNADGAIAAADQAVAIAERGADEEALAVFLLRRAELELALKRFDTALADARRASPLFRKLAGPGASSYVGRCYLVQGSALAASGQTAEAHSAFMSATENLRPTLGAQHAQTRLAERLAVASMASSGRK